MPWIHLETKSDGRLAPCCLSRNTVHKPNGEDYYLYKDSIEEAFHGPFMQNLRRSLASGVRDRNCEICWQEEKVGQVSRRSRENKKHEDLYEKLLLGQLEPTQPVYLDLKFGNLCNLKCRICTPYNSSKWVQERIDVYGNDSLPKFNDELKTLEPAEARRLMMNWHESNKDFWRILEKWLPHIREFEIYGGEPFLIKKHLDVLRLSVDRGHSKNQVLHYNTNGTIFPEEALTQIFPHFKSVSLMLSLDGTGRQYEYQRHPAKWDLALANFEKYKKTPFWVEICLTVSAVNLFYVPDYLEFWRSRDVNVYLNTVYMPDHFDYRIYPRRLKELVQTKFDRSDLGAYSKILTNSVSAHLTHMWSEDRSELWPEFVSTIDKHDRYRKESFAEVFPEFYDFAAPFWKT